MDTLITQWINAMAGHFAPLDLIMITVSNYGVPALVLCIAIQWWSITDRFHVRHAILSSGFSFILGLAINQIILLMIHRIRPYDAGITHLIIEPSADWSFPSDHATASFAALTGIAISLASSSNRNSGVGAPDLHLKDLRWNALCDRRSGRSPNWCNRRIAGLGNLSRRHWF